MEINSGFTVPLPREQAWAVLLDIPRIAPCMPGAKLTGADEENQRYDGEVQVRLGPVLLAFKGKATITDRNDDEFRATVHAEGRDTKGRGGATADVAFSLEPEGNESRVVIVTNLNLTGSVAQYGRGAGMINDLANHLIGQFAANLRKELEQSAPPPVAAQTAATDVASPGTTPAGSEAQAVPPAPESAAAANAGHSAPKARQAASSAPISGFRLGLWLFWRQIRRFFGAR